jgi:NTE family protein
LLCIHGRAQETIGAPPAMRDGRPRLGLVLSGGGARGGVHVGVLRALEELGVPIDFVAGTSIGAIIGGFYASGLSPDEIERVIQEIDWNAAFLEDTPRALKTFRRKRDDDLFLVDEKPGLNAGVFDLPLGVVQGQVIDLIIGEQTLPVSHVADFDDLRIPFRAVAADIATGEAVVLGSGNIAHAIRASMSVPAVLAPIELDGRLLVDGGIAMNLPVEVAREMGADIVIAVDITAPLEAREELRSVLDVTTQLTSILTRYGVDEQLALLRDDDLLLVPELSEEFGSTGFERMDETIPVGYELVMSNADSLRRLALEPPAYQAYRAALPDPTRPDLPTVEFIRVTNNSNISDAVIERHLNRLETGVPLDLEAVEVAVNKIYGMELYQNVRYELVTEGEQTGLEFQVDPRAWGPSYLELGLEFSSSGDEDATFALAASYLSTAINELNGEWRATAILGDEPALLADLYQPFGREGLFFIAPSLRLESKVVHVFENQMRIAELQQRETTLELAVGRELGTWGEVRAGIRGARGNVKLEVGEPGFVPVEDFDKGEFFTRLHMDTLDSLSFPRSGGLARLEWSGSRPDALSADVDFDQVSLTAGYAKSWDLYTLLTTFRYDATISGVAPVSSLFRLGGFLDLSGFNRNELSGQHAARVGATYYRRINDLALFPAFAGVSLELGNVWNNRSDVSLGDGIWGGSIWVGVDTPVGPVYVAYGRAERDASAFYIFLGRIF